jgi:hypothetical protein
MEMNDEELVEKGIIAIALNDTHVRIMPPMEEDSEDLADTKLFILACMTRRMVDRAFVEDMGDWLSSLSEEEFRAIHAGGVKVTRQ